MTHATRQKKTLPHSKGSDGDSKTNGMASRLLGMLASD